MLLVSLWGGLLTPWASSIWASTSSCSWWLTSMSTWAWDVTLTSRLFPSGSLMVVRTTAFPTPHAQIPRDLGLSLLVTGMWLENHLFCPSLLLGCRGPRPPRPASMCPLLGPLPVSLSRLLPVLLNFPVDPAFGAPPWLWSTPESDDRSVHKPPNLELSTCSAKRLWPRPTDLRGSLWQDVYSASKWRFPAHVVINAHVS